MLVLMILLCLILFFSTVIRTTFGFGDAIIAMPLLTVLIGIKEGAPIVAVISLIVSVFILMKDGKKVSFHGIKRLIFFVIIGIPIGIFYMTSTPEMLIKLVLAGVLIAFSSFRLYYPGSLHLKNDKLAPLFGLVSGVLGGAYNTNGPPIVVYGAIRKWDSDEFRTTLQGVFLPSNLFIIGGHAVSGFFTYSVFSYLLMSFPVVIGAMYLGEWIKNRIPAEKFIRYVDYFIFGLAAMLIINAFK